MKLIYLLFRALFQLIRDIDGIFTWATTFWHPKSELSGQCKQRGVCCQNIAVGVSQRINNSNKLMKIVNWWYTFVYNFKLKGWYKNDKMLIYSCKYLKMENAVFIGVDHLFVENTRDPNALVKPPCQAVVIVLLNPTSSKPSPNES